MLNRIIHWALKNRWLVTILGLALLIYGIVATGRTPIDVFPDFAPVQVVVLTEAPGFAPEEVESVITLPIESALNGTAGIKTMRSVSTVGLSAITMILMITPASLRLGKWSLSVCNPCKRICRVAWNSQS